MSKLNVEIHYASMICWGKSYCFNQGLLFWTSSSIFKK